MSASDILAAAQQRAEQRFEARPRIDYERMRREYPRQKATLTRAVRSGNRDAVILACRNAVRVWDEIGCWPDDWHRWQAALDDTLGWRSSVELRDLTA